MGMIMMKRRNSKTADCAALICCTILMLFFAAPAFCDETNTALMLEMSPADSGYLNIVPGVHSFDRFAQVALKATPKPGYQFVCWLGNVTDSSTGSTSVFLDSPKIVIAVFERSKFQTPELESDYIFSGSGGGLVRSGGSGDTSLDQAGGAKRVSYHYPHLPHKVPVPGDNGEIQPPVPGDNGQNPPPVPEPASLTLLLTGFFILINRRKHGEPDR
jgi:hypothetical protein